MEKWVIDVKKRANFSKVPLSGGRSDKLRKIKFDDFVFVPAQLNKRPVDYFKEKIETKTVIGKLSKKPLNLSMPILIAAMSFGALNKNVKIALAKASSRLRIATNTGEGGMLQEERKYANLLIAQYSTGRFGVDKNYLRNADAIEIKIGQGAKPGQGGLLPKEKVTEEIAKVRHIKMGYDVHSPAYHPDIKNVNDLRKKINWLRKESNGKPIIIKLGAGDVENDVKLAVKARPDVIAIDGLSGGTAAAPEVMLNDVGIPIIAALVRARKIMNKLKAKQELIVGGGINKGADIAKCLALGADAVFLGFSLLGAVGCIYCKLCYLGKCPAGVTTQDKKLMKRFDPNAVEHIVNFVNNCNEEVKMVAGAVGKDNVHKLNMNDLRSLSLLMERVSGVKLV